MSDRDDVTESVTYTGEAENTDKTNYYDDIDRDSDNEKAKKASKEFLSLDWLYGQEISPLLRVLGDLHGTRPARERKTIPRPLD